MAPDDADTGCDLDRRRRRSDGEHLRRPPSIALTPAFAPASRPAMRLGAAAVPRLASRPPIRVCVLQRSPRFPPVSISPLRALSLVAARERAAVEPHRERQRRAPPARAECPAAGGQGQGREGQHCGRGVPHAGVFVGRVRGGAVPHDGRGRHPRPDL
ncbi:hypothetical protein T484DRAFT_1924855 [Baffinella frigidus]|nr:hypothetical protein T484DRAFT_1924855 [Cryptophyta sp. CCMP2293]